MISLGMGREARHASSSEAGSTTLVMSAGPRVVGISCSHVLAPVDMYPVEGDSCVFDGHTFSNSLVAWTEMTLPRDVSADVAVADVGAVPPTSAWPDGVPFAGGAPSDPANGPFRIFGLRSTGAADAGGAPRTVTLTVDGVGPRNYLEHFLLPIPISQGDSGAPVRDGGGAIVGMVVAMDRPTLGAWCTPWTAVTAAIVALLGLPGE